MPVQNVNYVIKSLSANNESEYVVLEVWTDVSIIPQDAVEFALKKLTNLFCIISVTPLYVTTQSNGNEKKRKLCCFSLFAISKSSTLSL
mgnify:CR=1 FL=1